MHPSFYLKFASLLLLNICHAILSDNLGGGVVNPERKFWAYASGYLDYDNRLGKKLRKRGSARL